MLAGAVQTNLSEVRQVASIDIIEQAIHAAHVELGHRAVVATYRRVSLRDLIAYV